MTTVRFPAHGGARLDGALVGRGPIGVILLHQWPGPMCGWWAYAVYLAQHGYEALLFDLRCYGLSNCPAHDQGDPVGDVTAAASVLRRSGARGVAVIGASMGGAVAVLAADRMTPSPVAMVDLSAQMDDRGSRSGADVKPSCVENLGSPADGRFRDCMSQRATPPKGSRPLPTPGCAKLLAVSSGFSVGQGHG